MFYKIRALNGIMKEYEESVRILGVNSALDGVGSRHYQLNNSVMTS